MLTWYNSIPDLNKIEQSAAELQRLEDLKFWGGPHFGFQGKWTSILARPPGAHKNAHTRTQFE